MNTIGRAFTCAAARLLPSSSRGALRRCLAALLAVVPLLAFLGTAPDARATFNPLCSGCHGITDPGRINSAGANSVVWAAAVVNTMTGVTAGTDYTTEVNEIAASAPTPADTATVNYTAWNAATTSVAYGGVRTAVVPNVTLGGVLDQVSESPAVTGVSFTGTTMTFNHPGGASGNCSNRTITARGTGPTVTGGYTPLTSARTITVSVTPPAAPTAINDSTTLNYSTSAQAIDLSAIGAISGTPPATGSFVNLGALSPGFGARAATGPDTLTYASSATTYAPTLTLTYSVDGPCSTISATRTLTINVNLPPAPVVNHTSTVGSPLIVPAGAPTLIDLSLGPNASITGVVASSPPGVYPLAASQPAAPGSGTTSVSGDVVTYTPGAFTGPTTFTYTKAGPGGISNTETVFLDVTAAPVVSPTSVTTAYNTAIAVPLAGFISSTQPVLSVTPSAPVNGTALATGTTTITFTPTLDFFGTASFNYVATNAVGASTTAATVTVTVNPPPPTVAATTLTAAYNGGAPVQSTTIDLAPFITGPFTSVTPSGAVNGAVSVAGSVVTFTPTVGWIGPASFTYTATNPGGTSAPATVSVTVSPPPAPTVAPLTVLVSTTTPTLIDLAPLISGLYSSVSIVVTPSAGSVSISGTMVTYTPMPGFVGSTAFSYRATGLGGPSAPATVTLTYTAAPVTASRTLVVPYNAPATIDLTTAFAGVISGYSITTLPAHGTVSMSGPYVTYTPNRDYYGPDSFQFTAVGPGGSSVPGVVSVSVSPPVATLTELRVDVPFNTPTAIDLSRAVVGAATRFTITTPPARGTVTVSGNIALYTPNPGVFGADRFSFVAVNASGTSAPGEVVVNVGSLAPSAATASLTVPLNGSGTIDLAPFITGSGISGVAISVLPAHGLADVNGTQVTYTPRTNFFGSDAFTYVAYGNAGQSQSVEVAVTVVGRPDPAQDRTVIGILEAQAQAARRFSRAQSGNFQRRLESLHVGPPAAPPEQSTAPKAPAPVASVPVAPANPRALPAADPFGGAAQDRTGFVPASLTSGEARAKSAPAGSLPTALAGTLLSAASSKSIDVSGSTGGGATPGLQGGTNVWLGGLAHFGKRGGGDEGADLRFSTDGISLGADRRFSERLVLGMGLGYGRDRTDIGTDGSRSKASGTSFAGYGSYQPSRSTFIDAVLGFGSIDFDTDRYVDSVEAFATGRRKGSQVFGSLAAGYEMRKEGVLVSPYGRIDFAVDKLKQATESGAGLNALTFHEQTLRSTQAAAGLRLETRHETDFGWAAPRARIEYRREFEGGRTASLSYADQFGGPAYSVTPSGSSRNSLLFGVGSDFLWRRGLRIGIDYQGERSSGPGTTQSIRLLLSQDLDGKLPAWPWSWSWKPFSDPIGVEAGFSFDDNVGRGRLASEKLSDQVYSLGLNASRTFPINTNGRAVATAFLNVDKFHDHTGLGRTSGGLQGELQYRASGDFESITYALFARAWIDGYESRLRSGSRQSVGVNARRSLTDRIDVFGEVGVNWRRAESAVFEGRDYAARFNVDYSLGAAGTAYLAGEYRRGDTFSSGLPSLGNLNTAEVMVRDDAFDGRELFAYRAEARMLLGTLGYNRPLGPRDSLDFSVRRVQTTPLVRQENSGPSSYIVNQYSILYLMRF